MAKRMQGQKGEEIVVSKSRPAVMNLSSSKATSSLAASSPIASESPGMPIALGKHAGLRMDGTPALDLWDLVIDEIRSRRETCHKTPHST